jgi:hypothetical protein
MTPRIASIKPWKSKSDDTLIAPAGGPMRFAGFFGPVVQSDAPDIIFTRHNRYLVLFSPSRLFWQMLKGAPINESLRQDR